MKLNQIRATLLWSILALSVGQPAEAETLTRTVEVSPEDLSRQDRSGLTSFTLTGAIHGMPPGQPDLPLLPVRFLLPEGTRLSAVRVIPLDGIALPPSRQLTAAGKPGDTQLLPVQIAGPSAFPPDPVVSTHEGGMRGHSIVAISISPLTWSPDTGALRLMTRFRVEVETTPDRRRDQGLVIQRESSEGYRSMVSAISSLTGDIPLRERPRSARLLPLDSGEFAPTFRPSVDGSPVEMVIITTADQEAEYQRLADFKTRIGVTTVVRNLDWIIENYPEGVDVQETIRNFLKDAASKWGTVWVLLGGDSDQIPPRYGFTQWFGGRALITDLYYSDLDGTWNANGNDLFGEGENYSGPHDEVDLFPDVWVGRLPSNNVAEARNLVDKTLTYQQSPPLGYQNDLLLLGEVLFPDDWEEGQGWTMDGGLLCENAIGFTETHHRPVRLYENYTNYPGALPETKETVIDSISAGFGLVHHVGHGFINTMSVGIDGKTLGNIDAESFTNGNELFMLYTVNCTSCAIEFNCIAERFLANTSGGAVAVIGATDLEEAVFAAQLQNDFYGLLYDEGVQEIGQTMAMAKIPSIGSSAEDNWIRWAQFTQICLGDPNLHFWTDVPESLTVSHPIGFELGAGTFSVTVSRNGSPADSARVALFKDGDAYAVAYTDSLGQVGIPFAPDTTGTMSVGVFFRNSLPYLGTSEVVLPLTPYLVTTQLGILDDGSGGSDGNGDARMDAGETVELDYRIQNNGCVLESGITATLATSDPNITVIDDSSSYPSLDVGSFADANDPIIISIDRDAPDLLEAKATLTITGTSGTYVRDVILYVHAPEPEYWLQAVRDTIGNGNGDGAIAAGEDFAIIPYIRNPGEGVIRSAEVRLRSSDPAVTITDSISVLGDILSDDIGVNPMDGLAAVLSDVGSAHELTAVLIDAYGEVFTRSLDLTPPDSAFGLAGQGTASSITLSWDPIADSDLWGYVVYRANSPSGPFVRVSDWVNRSSYYEDRGLPPLSRRYYRVAGVDLSGNLGVESPVASSSTTLPLHTGWPVEVGTNTPAGVTMADLDDDSQYEILGGGETIYAMTFNGQDYIDGDSDARTLGPVFDSGGTTFWNTPSVGDVDGNGLPEIAATAWDGQVHLLDNLGQAMPGWPKSTEQVGIQFLNPVGSVCMADLDSDGDLEILATVGKALFGWHHDGTELIDGDSDPATDGVVISTSKAFSYCTPSAANIDGEPHREIMVGMRDGGLYVFEHDGTPYPGSPFVTGGNITSSPAIGDIDKDGQAEIVFGSSDSLLHAIRSDKSYAPGFPKTLIMNEDWDSSPALGDLNGDTYLDVVIGTSDGLVMAYSGQDGSIVPGFPALLIDNLGNPVPTRSSPVLADVDGNGSVDILIGDRDGRLHGLDNAAMPLAGFPIQTQNRIENAPLVWDIDGDGLVEVAVESKDQKIYCWDTPWAFNSNLAPWPMFKGNQGNTGEAGDPPLSGAQVGVGPKGTTPVLLQNFPNPFSRSTSIRYLVPEGAGHTAVELHVYDLRGRVIRTLAVGLRSPGVYEVLWNGRDDRGLPLASGIYPYRIRVGSHVETRKMILLGR